MAKLTKDGKHKGSSLTGKEAKGGSKAPITTERKMDRALKNTNGPGKKV